MKHYQRRDDPPIFMKREWPGGFTFGDRVQLASNDALGTVIQYPTVISGSLLAPKGAEGVPVALDGEPSCFIVVSPDELNFPQ